MHQGGAEGWRMRKGCDWQGGRQGRERGGAAKRTVRGVELAKDAGHNHGFLGGGGTEEKEVDAKVGLGWVVMSG